MKIGIKYLLISLFVISCSISKNNIDYDYIGENNYNNFYLVDTIKILEPIRVYSKKFGGPFVFSKAILNEYKLTSDFFERPDVFIYADDLYYALPTKDYEVYRYPDYGNCKHLVRENWNSTDLEIYSFSEDSIVFLMGMINANYYYIKYRNSNNNHVKYKETDYKRVFYKIIFPYRKIDN
ncbi:hypothetical protein HX004_14240 [Myroides sp. 1354]|uniref:hypothetical protein n=1 Tax=unclassified Myroides TaxID=2642485 RepID=UPI00257559C7|nr:MULTISPECIES: hypothetical protein [unclassified Myroides]MDM1045914.1 hypothetical protein [Myroides sp. R163-1]MDM1056924.1 hypothetical protein [Myroides sp. 1354]MDM1070119.1 hypothetical protein [Myroides sp. 1372]